MDASTAAIAAALIMGIVLGVIGTATWMADRRTDGGFRRPLTRDDLDPTTEALLQILPLPAIVYGESLRRVYVNPAYHRHERAVREVLRQEWFQRALKDAFLEGAATSRPASFDYPEDVHVLPLPGPRVVALLEDQTERFRTASLREDFIANASHELNTPVAAISLLAEAIMASAKKDSRIHRFALSLSNETDHLASLTKDIVRLAETKGAADRGTFELVDLRILAGHVVNTHLSLADQVNVALESVTVPPEGEDLWNVWGPRQHMEVVLGNIIENALQHSPSGQTVEIEVARTEKAVEVRVRDHGPGIAEDMHEQIFERFYRVDRARTRKAGGTGLGLSIARNAARAMGGEVFVESQPGKGSTFTFALSASMNPVPAENVGVPEMGSEDEGTQK